MLSLTKVEPAVLNPRPTLPTGESFHSGGRYWDQPDIRRNPKLWLKLYLEGLTIHRRSLALAYRADRVLDLGCGGGWFSIALANKRSDVVIDAIDVDGRLLDWGRYYAEARMVQAGTFGRIRFSETDIDEFSWQDHEEEFDLVHAGFILSRAKRPLEALAGIYKVLKPGGWLIYHDCTDPPSRNLNRLARVQHALEKWKDDTSDPWSWRRVWERRYRLDKVRAKSRTAQPTEQEVLRRLEELFAMRYQEQRRALLDMYLATFTTSNQPSRMFWLPAVKFLDDALCWTGVLVGGVRYVLGQKR